MTLREDGYWDEHYEIEIRNFEEDGDEGDIWFGEPLSRKIADHIIGEIRNNKTEANNDQRCVGLIDVGCGNAFLICTILERFKRTQTIVDDNKMSPEFNALGIDYSANSIELSKRVVTSRGLGDQVRLEQCDFLNTTQLKEKTCGANYNFIIDKGTFDAICLLASKSDDDLARARYNYIESINSLVDDSTPSTLVIASCNHTRDELIALFQIDSPTRCKSFEVVGEIDTPKLQFGGKEGSQVTCLVIRLSK